MLGVRVDRNATAVVLDRQRAVSLEGDFDQFGVAGDGLVHGVVQHLGEQVVQGPLIGAADVHAWTLADRLKALKDLYVGGGVGTAFERLRIGARLIALRQRRSRCRVQCVIEQVGKGTSGGL